ncbi:MAG: hypothetical protein MJK18_01910, partial [Bdellovibrionales bacterium]|nr:hypothetical protein [Bdellovibrionales bacterium]
MNLLTKLFVSAFLLIVGLTSSASAQNLQQQFIQQNLLSSSLVGVGLTDQIVRNQRKLVLPITVAVIDSGVGMFHPLLLP